MRRGHDVTLFASGDSYTLGRLVVTSEQSLHQRYSVTELQDIAGPMHLAMLGQVLQQASEFDIIHSHIGYWGFPFASLSPVPVLTTIHNRLDAPQLRQIFSQFPTSPLVSISQNQRGQLQGVRMNWAGNVYNGVPAEAFPFRAVPGSYLLYMGRITPSKQIDRAIELAVRSGMPLKIATTFSTVDEAYLERLRPQLAHPQVTYLGQVDEATKRDLMVNAYAIVLLAEAPEPFGMIIAESLACGTPTLTLRTSSASEVVYHNITGIVAASFNELVAAVPQISDIDRRVCRIEAEMRFSTQAMAENYERIYQRVQAEHYVHKDKPFQEDYALIARYFG